MRRLRRHAAALLGVLLLQVLFLGTGMACAPGAGGDAGAAAGGDPGAAHGTHAGHGTHAEDEGAPAPSDGAPEHATGPAHCLAAMSCASTGLAAARATLDDEGATTPLAVVGHDDAAPASIGGAPEPPPPRG